MSIWMKHVKKIQKENAGLPFKDVLKLAKKSYKKIKDEGDDYNLCAKCQRSFHINDLDMVKGRLLCRKCEKES